MAHPPEEVRVCNVCVYCSSTLHFVSGFSYSFINYSFIKATP